MTILRLFPWTCSCGAKCRARAQYCEACGAERSNAGDASPAQTGKQRRATCDCGASLLGSGLCADAGGYPASADPHAVLPSCPICRGPLEWSGACYRCFGTASGERRDWSFPGAEYQLDKGHWQETAPPGRRACLPEDNREAWRALKAVIGRIGG